MKRLTDPSVPQSVPSLLAAAASVLALLGALVAAPPVMADPDTAVSAELDLAVAAELAERPLPFVASRDEPSGELRFRVAGEAGAPTFHSEGIDFVSPVSAATTSEAALRLRFLDAVRDLRLEAGDELPGRINHIVGDDPEQWRLGVPTYDGLSYRGLYPGIDLTYGSAHGKLKGTYRLAREADPAHIRWRYEAAESVALEPGSGDLIVRTASGERFVEEAPVAWQEIDGERIDVPAAFRIAADGSVGFELGDYDPRLPLTIDPFFVYETVYDIGGLDSGDQLTVDGANNVYVVARASDTPPNIVILKVSADGEVLFTTFLGGSDFNYGADIVHDGRGHVVVTGWTTSDDFPTVEALYPQRLGSGDAFVTQLSADDGTIEWSTYFGGNRGDEGFAITADSRGDVVLAGATGSTDFPVTANAVQSQLDRTICFCDDGFVAKIANDGSRVLYGTYLGGSKTERLHAVDLDAHDNYFVAGVTDSADLPLANPIDATYGGDNDGFVARLSADGSSLDYSTYLGGSDGDQIGDLTVDRAGRAHVVGTTQSVDFPTTPTAFQPHFVGGINACGNPPFVPLHNCPDVFVTKISPLGDEIDFSTFLAGSREDYGKDVAVDAFGRVFVIGNTASNDFPRKPYSGNDIYISALDPNGHRLLGTLIVETGSPSGAQAIVSQHGDLFVTGAKNVPADTWIARIRPGGH